jgi:hypothetical protein
LHDADGSDFQPPHYLLRLTLAEQACQPMEHVGTTLARQEIVGRPRLGRQVSSFRRKRRDVAASTMTVQNDTLHAAVGDVHLKRGDA